MTEMETPTLLASFHSARGARQAASGDLSPTFLLVEILTLQQGVPDCTIVAQLSWIRPTAFQLELRPIPQKGVHIWYCKAGQKAAAEEVIGPNGEATTVIFLDGCGQPTAF